MINAENRGVTLLIAIVIALLVLSVGLSLTVLSVKEVTIAATLRDSIMATYATESGAECATYWTLQDDDYFSFSNSSTIHCNGKPLSVGGGSISEFIFDQDGKYFSYVKLERQSGEERLFDIGVEGYSGDPALGDNPRIVQQSLGIDITEACSFDPSDVDSFGDQAPDIPDFAENGSALGIQSVLDIYYPPSGTIDSINDQKKYQVWNINKKGTVFLEVKPLASSSGTLSNVFGYYFTDGTITDPDEIILQDKFRPVFKNRDSIYQDPYYEDVPKIADIVPNANGERAIKFKIETDENTSIGFAMMSDYEGSPPTIPPLFKLSEVMLNVGPQFTDPASRDFVIVYDVPEPFAQPGKPRYVIAFEDRGGRSGPTDSDFDDSVGEIRILSCVVTVKRF